MEIFSRPCGARFAISFNQNHHHDRRTTTNPFEFAPLDGSPSIGNVIAALLKQPGRVLHELVHGRAAAILAALGLAALVSLAIYGVVVGSLSGGAQYWIAPAKIVLGSTAAALICLPSLFVFLCMNGADAHLRQVCGLLVAGICLMAVLLVSFSPIAWVFSQSTDSVALMAALHLLLWTVAIGFGLRLLSRSAVMVWSGASSRLGLWVCIYVLVCLQMMTAVRPIVGTSEHFLPQKKQFFLTHWMHVLGVGARGDD
jgi:hypothetical protein